MANKLNNIHLITAIENSGGIGKDGTIPWHFHEDMKYFKNLTKGAGDNAVIMGRKTFQSLNYTPLPYRINVVLSRSDEIHQKYHNPKKNVFIFHDIESVISYIDGIQFDDVWVIGGNHIYHEFLTSYVQRVHSIYVTHVTNDYECDVYFPQIPTNFTLQRMHQTIEKDTLLKFKIFGHEL